jgi:predicted SprT family Zn-dependent metalloprotease
MVDKRGNDRTKRDVNARPSCERRVCDTFDVEKYLYDLQQALPQVPPISGWELKSLHEARDYVGMVRLVRKTMNVEVDLKVGLVNEGGPEDAVAWVYIPPDMPFYGTKEFSEMRITICLKKSLLKERTSDQVSIAIAHELSHVVLESINHPLRKCEKAVDLTAMLLGFGRLFETASHTKERVGNYIKSFDLGYLSEQEIQTANELLTPAHLRSKIKALRESPPKPPLWGLGRYTSVRRQPGTWGDAILHRSGLLTAARRRTISLISALLLTGGGLYVVSRVFAAGYFMGRTGMAGGAMVGIGLYWIWTDFINADPKPEKEHAPRFHWRTNGTWDATSPASAARGDAVGADGANLKAKIDPLARAAWGPREDIARTELILDRSELLGLGNEQVIAKMLRHVRNMAPKLNVPRMTPRVAVEPLCEAAGQFSENDGWVKITVGLSFFGNVPAAHAILCHELCHYVLNANGIRERSRDENERLTDAAMFVFGLGDIFLAGYRKDTNEYRPGHRLGYLTDSEYRFVNQYVRSLRQRGDHFASIEEEAEKRLLATIHDKGARSRLLASYRAKYPRKTLAEVIEAILADLAKDNR